MTELKHNREETLALESIELTILPQEAQTYKWNRKESLEILAQCDNNGFVEIRGHKHQIRRVTYESKGNDSLSHDITFEQYFELGRPHTIELKANYILKPHHDAL